MSRSRGSGAPTHERRAAMMPAPGQSPVPRQPSPAGTAARYGLVLPLGDGGEQPLERALATEGGDQPGGRGICGHGPAASRPDELGPLFLALDDALQAN